MTRTVTLLALGAIACTSQVFAQSQAQVFTFRDITAGQKLDVTKLGSCSKPDRGVDGELFCAKYPNSGEVAGRPLKFFGASVYNTQLVSVYATFNPIDFDTIAAAFTEKYGDACDRGSSDWESRGGLKAQSPYLEWCFSTGRLKLEKIGARIDEGRFMYTDEWKAPPPPPKVDF